MFNKIIVLLILFVVVFAKSTIKPKSSQRVPSKSPCAKGQFTCTASTNGSPCISLGQLCDGKSHCLDASDEREEICRNTKCPFYMYRCNYGACVKISSLCNGIFDCVDGSDERPISNCVIPGNPVPHPTTTTKRYTFFPYPTAPPTTHSTTVPPRPPTTRSTTVSPRPQTPSLLTTSTTSAGNLNTPAAGSCVLPAQTTDRTYTINDCVPNSSDPFCQRKEGQFVDFGVALNFRCTSTSQNFTSTCLEGNWLPPFEDCKPVTDSDVFPKTCGVFPKTFYANTHVPWQVGIFDRLNNQSHCGGVIVSSNVVISAAHCFYDEQQNWKRSPSEFYITAGKFARTRIVHARTHNVTRVRFSINSFQGSYNHFQNDIAVVEVQPEFQLNTDDINAVCLDMTGELKDNNKGMISLYNDNGGSGYTETTRVTFVKNEDCYSSVSNDWKPTVTSDKICLINQDVEKGNGGSGLYTLRSDQQTYHLKGVFSSTFTDVIIDGQVNTITDVFKHTWIHDTIIQLNQTRTNTSSTSNTTSIPDELNIDVRIPMRNKNN